MKFVLAIFALLGLAAAVPVIEQPLFSQEIYAAEWEKFVTTFEQTFVDEAEKLFRFSVFQRNFDYIHLFNKDSTSVRLAVNQFAAMTKSEFSAKYLGLRPRTSVRSVASSLLNATALPAAIDWTTKGAVTPVKNQQQCGSCWAFSSTGSMEGAIFLKTGKLVSLSEQALVDCGSETGNQGCNGGLMDQAFQYAEKHGLPTEASYPYKAADGKCKTFTASPSTKLTSFKDVPVNNEAALKAAVAQQPVSVAIEADQQVFQFYSSGVLDSASCGTQLDHGVLVVGYGKDAGSGKDFWKVKNSWGASWGMSGYILMKRNDKGTDAGMCGINSAASYPVV